MCLRTWCACAVVLISCQAAVGQDILNYEDPPIGYSNGVADNPVSRLQTRLSQGAVRWAFDAKFGYLPALLDELKIARSSQVLTFAKTSLQSSYIGPATPRAIYFNDEVHVGFVTADDLSATVLELAVADRKLGTVFYTLSQSAAASPKFARQTNRCLNCHGDVKTRGVPGLLVRSVHPDPQGRPVIAAGSFRTDHASPLKQRWGGWYVTGTHGTQTHLGNFTLPTAKKPKTIDNPAGQNVTDLARRFATDRYLTGHSDLVALMVLEHQIDAINYITRLRFEAELSAKDRDDKRLAAAVEQLVKHLLFANELKLTEPVKGSSTFADDYAKLGPADKRGRSLRQFDLQTRLFKYPCSCTIYSDAFASLPAHVKEAVYKHLWTVLTSPTPAPGFAHLSGADRQAIVEILGHTRADIPNYWR